MRKFFILALVGNNLACESNIDLFADFLYWHTSESTDWAYTLTIEGNTERGDFRTLSFDWDPGYRVGIGYTNEWDTQLYYTWFHSETSGHIPSGSGPITSVFLGPKVSFIGKFESAQVKAKIDYNIFDWDLGRSFYVSDYLVLHPLIGLKGGWINQKMHTAWQNNHFLEFFHLRATEDFKNDFYGVGPKGGINGKWLLNDYFNVFGDFSGAFMWGHWTNRDRFQDNVLNTSVTVQAGEKNFGAMVAHAFVGIGLDINYFSLKVGYEIEDWFNYYQGFDNLTGGNSNELILQGLTLDARYDF